MSYARKTARTHVRFRSKFFHTGAPAW
jgi:hypothetical protein